MMTTTTPRTPDVSTDIDNGQLKITVNGFAPIIVDPADYPSSLVDYAALHGFKQRYVDAAALGAGSTCDEKHAAIMALVTHHRETGEWLRTPGKGDGVGSDGLLVRAIAEACALPMDVARAEVGKMDKKTQAQLRLNDPTLRPIIERLRVERAAKGPKVDTTATLQKLMALGRTHA